MKTQILCAMRDSSAVIPALRTLEDEQDCVFRVVQSGEGALSAAKKCKPDILLIDAVLPLMDGLGTVDRLREIYGERMPQVIGGVMMPFARDGFLRRGVTCQVRVPWDAQEYTGAHADAQEGARRGGLDAAGAGLPTRRRAAQQNGHEIDAARIRIPIQRGGACVGGRKPDGCGRRHAV